MADQTRKRLKLTAALLFSIAIALITVLVIYGSGIYPRGFDTMYHLYRSMSLTDSIKSGDLYPLYDSFLYNGVQAMRYWAPLPVYVLSLCQLIAGGDILNGYLVYTGFLIVLGSAGWLLWGYRYNRMALTAFLGPLWFFMPNTLLVYFIHGNLPRGLIAALTPWLLYFIWQFLEEKRSRCVIGVVLLVSVMALCHIGQTGIVLLCLLLFFLIYAILNRRGREILWLLLGVLISFCLIGIWLVPSLQGGLVSMGDSNIQVMKGSFGNGFTSLNPFARFDYQGYLYFGLAAFVIILMGILFGKRKTFPGFFSGLIIYAGTTLSLYPLISRLPMGSLFWMDRFITNALAFLFMSLILWGTLRKSLTIGFSILLLLDCIPSFSLIYAAPEERAISAEAAMEERAGGYCLQELKEHTRQRTAVMDQSSYGAFVPYYLSGLSPKVAQTFGAAWQSAKTAPNIVQLNTALSSGAFHYLFDRCLELGNDTVLIVLDELPHLEADLEAVTEAAAESGYHQITRNGAVVLYGLDTEGNFGTVTEYTGISIGSSSRDIALTYPSFQETSDPNLNHYTFEDLSSYKIIYLSGFTYDVREEAEALVTRLSESGVRIYIDMQQIPLDRQTNTYRFLGVTAQPVTFENDFPPLHFGDTVIRPDSFDSDYENWNTVYLLGLDSVDGYSSVNGEPLPFLGTAVHPDIYFMGFNLLFHAQTAQDSKTISLLDQIFDLKENTLPKRELVPLTITYEQNRITITAPKDQVHTALASHDIFQSTPAASEQNNLLIVNSGTTVITMDYPYFVPALLLSLTGVVLLIAYLILTRKLFSSKSVK